MGNFNSCLFCFNPIKQKEKQKVYNKTLKKKKKKYFKKKFTTSKGPPVFS